MDKNSELLTKLKERYLILKKSCERYDQGSGEEILTIAVSLRVLLDGHGQKSLLAQLSKEFNVNSRIINYHVNQDVSSCIFHLGIRIDIVDGVAEFVPRLHLPDGGMRKTTVPSWLKCVVIKVNNITLTVEDLILGMTNKDGGAHIDLDPKSQYIKLTRSVLPLRVGMQDTFDMGKFQNASVRESAFCVLSMLEEYFPYLKE